MLKTAFANLIAAKIAAATAVAAAAAGGVALAAATGNLPGPLQHAAHAAFNAPAANPTHPAPSESDDPSESAPASPATESSDEASGRPSDAGTPSPSLNGLCKAFQAGATSNPGKALNNPAFSVLVATAGGKDNVAAYCVTLVGPAPTHPGAPSTHPNGPRSSHPAHPTGAPLTHPAGPPASVPAALPSGLPTHP